MPNGGPDTRFFDVGGRLVVPGKEPNSFFLRSSFHRLAIQLREEGVDGCLIVRFKLGLIAFGAFFES